MVNTCLTEEGLDIGNHPGEDNVHEKKIEGEENGGKNDDQCGAVDLLAGRPGHFLDFRAHIFQKI
jgi:hypothetical protein